MDTIYKTLQKEIEMTEAQAIEQSTKMLKGQLDEEQFIDLFDDFLNHPKHFELYEILWVLYYYF